MNNIERGAINTIMHWIRGWHERNTLPDTARCAT